MRDGRVVCRQLGFPDARRILIGTDRDHFDRTSRPWLNEVACTGEERDIFDCPQRGFESYTHEEYHNAGVQCSSKEGLIVIFSCFTPVKPSKGDNFACVCRGEGGSAAVNVTWYKENTQTTETKKEEQTLVLENVGETDMGIYKCVAEDNDRKDEKSINVVLPQRITAVINCSSAIIADEGDNLTCVCKNGGIPAANVSWYKENTRMETEIGERQTLVLRNVVEQDNGIYSCVVQRHNLTERKSISLKVHPALPVRLKGPSSENGTGRMEVFLDGRWGRVCDLYHDNDLTVVFCRQLGYLGVSDKFNFWNVPKGYDPPVPVYEIFCEKEHKNIASCNYRIYRDKCEDAGVACRKTGVTETVRMNVAYDGLGGSIEIFHNGRWGFILDSGWDMRDARVVCRQLGYPDAKRALLGVDVDNPDKTQHPWLDNVACTGKERNILDCPHGGFEDHSFEFDSNAGVQCSSKEGPTVIFSCFGPITLNKGDNFTCVCRGEGGTAAVNVTWYKENTQITETKKEEQTLVLENVGETDTGIYKCVAQEHDRKDENSLDVAVVPMTLPLRLRGPLKEQGIGRVEVFLYGKWGSVCDPHWWFTDESKVICRQLGYMGTPKELAYVPRSYGPMFIVECDGTEPNITSCYYHTYIEAGDCTHFEDAGVHCEHKEVKNKADSVTPELTPSSSYTTILNENGVAATHRIDTTTALNYSPLGSYVATTPHDRGDGGFSSESLHMEKKHTVIKPSNATVSYNSISKTIAGNIYLHSDIASTEKMRNVTALNLSPTVSNNMTVKHHPGNTYKVQGSESSSFFIYRSSRSDQSISIDRFENNQFISKTFSIPNTSTGLYKSTATNTLRKSHYDTIIQTPHKTHTTTVLKHSSNVDHKSAIGNSDDTDESANSIEWYIIFVAILVPGIVVGILTAIIIYCRRRRRAIYDNQEEMNLTGFKTKKSEFAADAEDENDQLIFG
ncbi:deleted in malignant brain tumors 1 protein-like [Dendronephthya gigantea]|uniref:deleted in malignant brain tumors 1 protein-like n=1 Tax=Dendronephthya gigantea TaxID=151771 RepID=UPI00106B4104|nr:deleted in malignant brain tumors 1 protein-like [Dendronephthya gigantea]